MNLTATSPSDNGPTDGHRHILRRRIGVAMLGAAVLSAAACGAPATDAARSRATPPTTSTTAAPPAASPSSAPEASTSTTSTTTVATLTAPRPTALRDELVAVNGAHLHVRCVGRGDTTVVLIAGFETGDDNWGQVEPDIAARARVCSYARPGTGTSDPAVSTETFATQAAQLRALLATVGEPGPYVVVGHSFGGAEAVTFASRYADQVTGVVLIDASPDSWPTDLCAVADDGSDLANTIRTNCAAWADPAGNLEHLDIFGSFAQVAGITSLGALPMTVVTAVDRQFPGLGPVELARLTDAWDQGQQRWSELSTASHVVAVADTSHQIELDRPDVVIDAVVRLLP